METNDTNVVENLRRATGSENQMNIITHKISNASGYKGIYAKTSKGKFAGWCVRTGLDNRRVELGT